MKRGIFDVLRRSFDNTLANWPLIVIRFGESVLFAILAIVAAIAIIAPILLSVGVNIAEIASPEDLEGVAAMLFSRWTLLLWIFLGISVLLVVFVAIHSLVEAGSARVYIDAERVAGPELEGPRSRFKVFSMQRWWAGAVDGWWTVFWIYNLAWGAAMLILLIPLLPTAALTWMLRDQENPVAVFATGCLGLLLTLLMFIVVAIVAAIWTNRAIIDWATRRAGARDALDAGWKAMRGDLPRHVLIAIALYVVMIAGSSFFGSFSIMTGFTDIAGSESGLTFMITLPLRILTTLCSYAFTAGVTAWFLAAYASVASE